VSVTAGSGRDSDATTTAALPETMIGARRLTSPSRLDSSGAIMPTTPVGSGTLKLKKLPFTGFTVPSVWVYLSAQPAYHTQRSMAAFTSRVARCRPTPSAAITSAMNWSRRPSISSAMRYRIWPRLNAVRAAQPGNALRAARTASRMSFRVPRQALASSRPRASKTS